MTKFIEEPIVKNFPIEFFGTIYSDTSSLAINQRKDQFCPYIQRECTKPRKSEPHIKIGICSVGYKGFLPEYKPNIICPHRFLEKNLFADIKNFFVPNWKNTHVVSEVSMGSGGSVDYVLYTKDEENINDFLCVELQANGTTGSPYNYTLELLKDKKYSGNSYIYGLNWANEFSKTMMQQAYKKGKIATVWNKKIVFIIQNVAMEYLQKSMNCSNLRQDKNDHIHFLMFKMVWSEQKSKYNLEIDSWYSTDVDGISVMLGGGMEDAYPTQQQFIKVIERRENASL